MLKHMLTATTPGPRAQPVDLGGGSRHHNHQHLNHHHHHHHQGSSIRQHQQSTTLSPQQLNLSIQSQRLNHSHALSTLSTSKHSLGGNSSSVSPGANISFNHQPPALSLAPQILSPTPKLANGGLHIARRSIPTSASTQVTRIQGKRISTSSNAGSSSGVREMLTSLGLLCLVSLLLALLALIFLLKISPAAEVTPPSRSANDQTVVSFEEYVVVYEVTLALCALTLSLNLCCLLVCAIQFLFAVKLARTPQGGERTNKYLQKSSVTRVCAVGGFFVSIPVFLTGIILYTFIQFHSTPAIITSVFIGLGIIFCGCAMVHNVFVWQREKTNAVKALAQQQHQQHQLSVAASEHAGSSSDRMHLSIRQDTPVSPGSQGMPAATLDLSALVVNPHELSTLV